MIEVLLEIVKDPVTTALWGFSIGFFVRHLVAKADEKSMKERHAIDQMIWQLVLEESKKIREKNQ